MVLNLLLPVETGDPMERVRAAQKTKGLVVPLSDEQNQAIAEDQLNNPKMGFQGDSAHPEPVVVPVSKHFLVLHKASGSQMVHEFVLVDTALTLQLLYQPGRCASSEQVTYCGITSSRCLALMFSSKYAPRNISLCMACSWMRGGCLSTRQAWPAYLHMLTTPGPATLLLLDDPL